MLHLVYKITNQVNGKYYIGLHSTEDLNDGYMGSGDLIKAAIRKYGVSNFIREILFSLETREIAACKERELLTPETVSDPNCYNILAGDGKRHKKEREIFSPEATKLQVPEHLQYDNEYLYVFKPAQEGLTKWKEHLLKFRHNPLQRLLYDDNDEIWNAMLNNLTEWFNSLKTHHKAKKILRIIAGKNLLDCLYIEQVPRNLNSEETANEKISEWLTLKI